MSLTSFIVVLITDLYLPLAVSVALLFGRFVKSSVAPVVFKKEQVLQSLVFDLFVFFLDFNLQSEEIVSEYAKKACKEPLSNARIARSAISEDVFRVLRES